MDLHAAELILASKSPRRRELIAHLGIPVSFVDIDVDEVVDPSLPVSVIPEQLARLKASAYPAVSLTDNQVLITADTVVDIDNELLGKPHSRDSAIALLQRLSGRQHAVHSGVCLSSNHHSRSFTETSLVFFRKLSDEMILYYVDNFSCLDKAGAYGIQDWIGMVGVHRIEGCFYNVMGLPLSRLYAELQSF